MKMPRRHQGAALILVLWLVAALSLVVLASAHGIRQQTRHMGLSLERLRSESVLDAALQLIAQRMVSEKGTAAQYRRQRMVLGGSTIWLEITPANGLVDINVASDALFQALFQNVGRLAPGEAAVMVSRVRDFIDPDDVPSGIGGAEAAQYRAANWPAVPRNTGLDDLSELKAVLGMTPALYETIFPYLSINGEQRIDIRSAPSALIDALTGESGLGARIHSSPSDTQTSVPLSGIAAEFFTSAPAGGAQALRVRVFMQTEGGRWWQREAWIDLNERPDGLMPWTTLSLEPTRRVNNPEQEFKP